MNKHFPINRAFAATQNSSGPTVDELIEELPPFAKDDFVPPNRRPKPQEPQLEFLQLLLPQAA